MLGFCDNDMDSAVVRQWPVRIGFDKYAGSLSIAFNMRA